MVIFYQRLCPSQKKGEGLLFRLAENRERAELVVVANVLIKQSLEHKPHDMSLPGEVLTDRTLVLALKVQNGIDLKTAQEHQPDGGLPDGLTKSPDTEYFIDIVFRQEFPSLCDVPESRSLTALPGYRLRERMLGNGLRIVQVLTEQQMSLRQGPTEKTGLHWTMPRRAGRWSRFCARQRIPHGSFTISQKSSETLIGGCDFNKESCLVLQCSRPERACAIRMRFECTFPESTLESGRFQIAEKIERNGNLVAEEGAAGTNDRYVKIRCHTAISIAEAG